MACTTELHVRIKSLQLFREFLASTSSQTAIDQTLCTYNIAVYVTSVAIIDMLQLLLNDYGFSSK